MILALLVNRLVTCTNDNVIESYCARKLTLVSFVYRMIVSIFSASSAGGQFLLGSDLVTMRDKITTLIRTHIVDNGS